MELIVESATSKIFEIKPDTILKVVNKNFSPSYPYYLFVAEYCNHKNILLPSQVSLINGEIHILMPKAIPLNKETSVDTKRLLVDVLDALCYFEKYGLIYGDIKPQNIVLWHNNYCLIDFDILVTKGVNSYLSQSINDIHGHALRADLSDPLYDSFTQALYALTITLMVYQDKKNRRYFDADTIQTACINIAGMKCSFPASITAIQISENVDKWIEDHFPDDWRAFIQKCIGDDKFLSFAEARDHIFLEEFTKENTSHPKEPISLETSLEALMELKGYDSCTRKLYTYACIKGVPDHFLFHTYNLYYKYYSLFEDKRELLHACFFPWTCDYTSALTQEIVRIDKGHYITERLNIHLTARLLLEYLVPGSWTLCIDKPLSEVRQETKTWPNQPERILYERHSVINCYY